MNLIQILNYNFFKVQLTILTVHALTIFQKYVCNKNAEGKKN